MVGVLLFAIGCGGPLATSENHSTGSALTDFGSELPGISHDPLGKTPNRIVLEAGVIFTNEASYVCYPLNQLGISTTRSVQSIESSCECVKPSLVRCQGTAQQAFDALRIDFIPEGKVLKADSLPISPSLLSVEVRLVLVDADVLNIRVQFLQTLPTYHSPVGQALP